MVFECYFIFYYIGVLDFCFFMEIFKVVGYIIFRGVILFNI